MRDLDQDVRRPRRVTGSCLLAAALAAGLAGAAEAAPPIRLDGVDDDWSRQRPALIDPADAKPGSLDIGPVHVSSDEAFVHWRIELGLEVNLQRLPAPLEILIDADGDAATGRREAELAGVDLAVIMSPRDAARPDEPGQGVTVRWAGVGPPGPEEGRPNPAYGLDWVSAPTHSSTWFEMRLRRGPAWAGGPELFRGPSFAFVVRVVDRDGSAADRTDVVTVALATPDDAGPHGPDDVDPLARPAEATLRVVSWNTEWGSLFDDPKPFRNVLRALRPDVLLLQEIPDRHPSDELAAVIEDMLPAPEGRQWRLVYAEGGGNLRTAVASIEPITPLESLQLVPYPQRPDRSVRVAGAVVHHGEQRIAFASVHLTCCGGLGEERDQRRQTEASLINDGLRRARSYAPVAGVIVAGDFNLVGSPRPLEIMAAGLDRDETPLAVATAMQLDGRSNVTWADARQPFAPGRLDFLLYSGSSLKLLRSFTLESADLSARWRDHHELNVNDTEVAADHLPIVADFAVR